ncbi:MAG: hypothetical protein ABJN40_18250 [Sneathiella sp.]
MRKLHTRLFGDVWRWAGTYRLREKNIGIDPFHITIQLHTLLDDGRYWAEHSVYDPHEAAARPIIGWYRYIHFPMAMVGTPA